MDAVTMVNPEIISASATQVLGEEGCLSVPEQRGRVARAEEIQVRYFTLEEMKWFKCSRLSGTNCTARN